ncbi:MAG TPA: hypothetical protein DCL38_03090 [Lachnospiraceae bacterium]|nr:hypothetical protein [Lachnospiraceae bacterium]
MNQAQIDCKKLLENVSIIRRSVPESAELAAVVKGDAYGHGITAVSTILGKCDDISMLVVASLDEAMKVYDAGVTKQILILGDPSRDEIERVLAGRSKEEQPALIDRLIFSMYCPKELEDFCGLAHRFDGHSFNVHIRLDFASGVRGVSRREYPQIRELLSDEKKVNICGIYAHVYSAYQNDPVKTRRDLEEYAAVFREIPEELRRRLKLHLLSSVSSFCYPEYTFDMVRIGALLYGMPVRPVEGKSFRTGMVMTITCLVLRCVELNENAVLDYEGNLPEGVRRVALISAGNWDIPQFFRSRRPRVSIRGKLFPIVGSPCMDNCCVDITGNDDVMPGDTVYILGDLPGVTFMEWVEATGFDYDDCQMLLAGINRLSKSLVFSEAADSTEGVVL